MKQTAGTLQGIILLLAQVLPVMAVVVLLPAIPGLFKQFGGVSGADWLVPAIVTTPALCIAVFAPLAGWMIDRLGRRLTINLSLTLYAVTGLAPLFLSSLPAIIFTRALLGIAEAGIVTAVNTLTADYFGEQRRKWLAWQSAANSLFGTAFLAVGGLLASVSWRMPFAIYGLAIPLALLSLVWINEPAVRAAPSAVRAKHAFPWRSAVLFGSVTFVGSVLYYVEPLNIASVMSATGLASPSLTGLLLAGTSIAYIAGALLYKRLSGWPIETLVGLAAGLIGAGMIGIGASSRYSTVACWATVQQLGGGMIIPILIAWSQGLVSEEHRGRGMGVWATCFFAGMFCCSPVVHVVASEAGGLQPAILYLGVVAAVVGAAALLLQSLRRTKAH
jgi:MFS family permease